MYACSRVRLRVRVYGHMFYLTSSEYVRRLSTYQCRVSVIDSLFRLTRNAACVIDFSCTETVRYLPFSYSMTRRRFSAVGREPVRSLYLELLATITTNLFSAAAPVIQLATFQSGLLK